MSLHNFVFSNKPTQRIWRHISFWVAWYVYQVMLFLYNNSNIQNSFWQTLKVRCEKLIVVLPIGIIQCYIIVYWLIPKFLLKKKYFSFICGVIISSSAVIFFVDLYTLPEFNFETIWLSIISYISRAGPVFCAVFIIIKMLKTWYLKEREKETLLNENLNAELQLLKAQVHPHFLFNTLNNIYSFILSNPPKAQGLVQKLEKMLQYMITECDQPLVPLIKEINFIRDYLGLEKVRYGKRLDMQVEISNDCINKRITPLLMIPFVENSFKHGASKMLKKPWIKLSIRVDANILNLNLVNSKPLNEIKKNNNNGIGLLNVKKRLNLLYPGKNLLTIEETINTYAVHMQVPLEDSFIMT